MCKTITICLWLSVCLCVCMYVCMCVCVCLSLIHLLTHPSIPVLEELFHSRRSSHNFPRASPADWSDISTVIFILYPLLDCMAWKCLRERFHMCAVCAPVLELTLLWPSKERQFQRPHLNILCFLWQSSIMQYRKIVCVCLCVCVCVCVCVCCLL